MKVGDYVRTNEGIRKIEKIYKYDVLTDISFNEYSSNLNDRKDLENQIIKSSPNIIDLIEVGDFITYKQGNIYWNIPERVSGRYNRQNEQTNLIANGTPLEHLEILTIVTKEQFESMEYKVN